MNDHTLSDHACPSCGYVHPDMNDINVQVGSITIDVADLRDALNGKPVNLPQQVARIRESERRTLRNLPMTLEEATDIAQQLWGRSFHDEREYRAGLDANAQRRGQISRDLKAELRVAHRMKRRYG